MLLVLRALLLPLACSGPGPSTPAPPPGAPATGGRPGDLPATARQELHQALLEDLAAPRHASDGQGRAWRVADPTRDGPFQAGGTGTFELVFEVGPAGIAEGGAVFLQASPWWGWSTPQVEGPGLDGYTILSVDPPLPAGVTLAPATLDQGLLAVFAQGGALPAGTRLTFLYGAGRAGAVVDRFAEHESPLWFAVDGDGDGVRKVIADPPTVDITAGPPERLLVTVSSSARPGRPARLTVTLVDGRGNAGYPFEGDVDLPAPRAPGLPDRVTLARADGGHRTVPWVPTAAGTWRVEARVGSLSATSNPLVVRDDAPEVRWADLHGHSVLSDGSGTPEDWYAYARDVAALDAAALTDHDHWGLQPLDQHPALWDRIRAATRSFHAPGQFVTLLGYEWTSWTWGHRHVLYVGDDGPILSSLDPATDTPGELARALAALPGVEALVMAHHPAGGPVAAAWDAVPDPRQEPLLEVVSVHGCSEAADCPGPIYDAVPGAFARDILRAGGRFGFSGGGDGHDGHPGLTRLAGPAGGLTAIQGAAVDRTSIASALRARRTWATNGPRIWVDATLGGLPMGAPVPPGVAELHVEIHGTAPLDRVEVLLGDGSVEALPTDGGLDLEARRTLTLPRGGFAYLRVVQRDGGLALVSPWTAGPPPQDLDDDKRPPGGLD